jgi:hypothetical protein
MQVRAALSRLPLYFIQNQGQLDSQVAYYVQGRGRAVYFSPGGVTFSFTGTHPPSSNTDTTTLPEQLKPDSAPTQDGAPQRWAVKIDFLGADPAVEPLGRDLTPAVVSYFKGPAEEWRTGLATYATVVYPDLWPGIDLVYAGNPERLKYTFVVKPGADPDQIKLAYRGPRR